MNTQIKSLLAAAAIAVVIPSIAIAQDANSKGAPATTATSAAAADTSDAEVRKIDIEAGKITLKHGEIKNLDMPGMTMVFVVKNKAQLEKLKPGDKVKFKAINDGGKFTVTDIQPAP